LKAQRFLFLALWQTLENEETLQAKILPWYIEIYNKSYINKSAIIVLYHMKNPAWLIEKPPVKSSKRRGNFSCNSFKNCNGHASTSKPISNIYKKYVLFSVK